MKLKTIIFSLLFCAVSAFAQNDPVIMTINGKDINRSEFEYSFNKNNSEGVVDKKNVEEYLDLFINYKLKVEAAKVARLDTISTFKKEFLSYRDQQIRPYFVTEEDIENEAKSIYKDAQQKIDSLGGLVKPAHILLRFPEKMSASEEKKIEQRADSIYNAIKKGADFAKLAKQLSQDNGSAKNGGEIGWIQKGATVKEFEDVAYALKVGEISKPVKSQFGLHIIKVIDKGNFFPYDSVRTDIMQYMILSNVKENIINRNIEKLAKEQGITIEDVVNNKSQELQAQDSNLRNLIREYHDGLLLFEISEKNIWGKASQDEKSLLKTFKKNREKYNWKEPHFKGIVYHVKDNEDIEKIKTCIKNVPFEDWGNKLRQEFNNDSIIRVRVEKGIFKAGDNTLIDKEIFNKNVEVKSLKDYPIEGTFGKVITQPEEYKDVKGQVVSDYQDELEQKWVKDLRKTYKVKVNNEVLQTVNKHN